MALNLGFGLGVGIGAIFLAVGVLLLVSKKAKALAKAVPLVNKLPLVLVAVALLVVGFSAGGISWYKGQLSGATASITGTPSGVVSASTLNCKFVDSVGGSGLMYLNVTSSKDVNDNQHITAIIKNATGTGAMTMVANITCSRTGDIDKAEAFACYGIADNFRNEESTTDSAVYYIVATSNTKSAIAGVPWQQSIFLADNTGALTSSDKEELEWAFASGTASKKLGVAFTLAGDTTFNHLTGTQATPDVKVYCANKLVGRITVDKDGGTWV